MMITIRIIGELSNPSSIASIRPIGLVQTENPTD